MQKETISMKYFFSNDEKLKIADEFAQGQSRLNSLEEQKKSAMSDFNSRINIVKEQINLGTGKLTNGYEMRDIDCLVEYHKPETNKKTITRGDTGEVIVEHMVQWDYHLFNMEVIEENELLEEADQDPAQEAFDRANEILDEMDQLHQVPFVVKKTEPEGEKPAKRSHHKKKT